MTETMEELEPLQEPRQEPMKKKRRKPADPLRAAGLVMQQFDPRTQRQKDALFHWEDGQNLLLTGVAGTGKTYLALYLAFSTSPKYANGVVIVRSAVPSRDMGFMPGDAKEKAANFEAPYEGVISELFGRGDAYQMAKGHELVKFLTTSYLRGITLKDCVLVIEEFQNMSFQELDTIITRVGENARVIVTGDFAQTDLQYEDEKRGASKFASILERMDCFEPIQFLVEDVQRSGLVKAYLEAKEK
jgi:phosphate starvation-inducible protein PhoH